MWDLSRPDWAKRLMAKQSLLPDLPLFEDEASLGLGIFNEICLPDIPGTPPLGEACGQWFKDVVRAAFGSFDPKSNTRLIREIFLLAPKGSSKTSYSAGLLLTAMLMNKRPRTEMLFVGPTQSISDRAFDQAEGMVSLSPDLMRRFLPRPHNKTILDKLNGSELSVKTFDLKILTGSKPSLVLLDELHLLGKNTHTAKVLRQIRGGLEKTPEGLLLIATTQSDDVPAGAFKDELLMAREIRDGKYRGKNIKAILPLLYEFPLDIAKDRSRWENPENWQYVMPNLGRSVQLPSLILDWETEKEKGEEAIAVWASQHLNIEMGIGLHTNRWAGADFWLGATDKTLTLDALLARSDTVTIGIDGGGLDDLLGLCVLGRDSDTRKWLHWSKAWCHPKVLELRKEIAPKLLDLQKSGDLVILDKVGQDVVEVVEIINKIEEAGLLPGKGAIGVDPVGITDIIDELELRGFDTSQDGGRVIGIPQGWTLSNPIKTTERRLAAGDMVHCGQDLMVWCVGNAKVEPRGNAIMITKQAAGTAKIDPLMATFNAVALMVRNPETAGAAEIFAL